MPNRPPVASETVHHADVAPPWPAAFRALVQRRHTLMLQGPMGSFFSDLAALLVDRGQAVTKVHFNGGDQVFWHHRGSLRYRGTLAELDGWLRTLMLERGVDAVVLFGQMRPIHAVARQVAKSMGVQVFVFEEGYLRPDWVTVERRGVNALSLQPRLASFYRDTHPPAFSPPRPTGQGIWRLTAIAAWYGLAYWLLRPLYGPVPHHRSMNPLRESALWLRGGLRHVMYAWRERGQLAELSGASMSRRWFLVPLQVTDDSQVRDHSRFASVAEFIEEVVESFARHAPSDALLVLKHHPMDRAYSDYRHLVARLRRRHGLGARLRYLHDQHLPTLLHHARGVVTINSTVGLQALYHGVPVKTMADSVYQIPGLVHGGELEGFWQAPGVVDAALFSRFRAHLVASTQLNASFYARRPALAAPPAAAPFSERVGPAAAPAASAGAAGEVGVIPAGALVPPVAAPAAGVGVGVAVGAGAGAGAPHARPPAFDATAEAVASLG